MRGDSEAATAARRPRRRRVRRRADGLRGLAAEAAGRAHRSGRTPRPREQAGGAVRASRLPRLRDPGARRLQVPRHGPTGPGRPPRRLQGGRTRALRPAGGGSRDRVLRCTRRRPQPQRLRRRHLRRRGAGGVAHLRRAGLRGTARPSAPKRLRARLLDRRVRGGPRRTGSRDLARRRHRLGARRRRGRPRSSCRTRMRRPTTRR